MAVKRIEVVLSATSAKFVDAMTEMEDSAHKETDEVAARFDRMGERVGRVFESIAAKGEEMNVAGSGALGSFGNKLSETEGKSKSFGSSMVSLGNKMMLGLAAGAAGVGYESVKIAMAYDKAHASLVAAVDASGQSFNRLSPAVAAADAKMTGLGFTEAQTESALAAGVISTQSLHKSLGALGLAADLARVKNIDLASSMGIINKALIGNLRPLKQLGIDLNVPTANAHALWKAQQTLTDAQIKARDVQIQYGSQVNAGGKDWAQYQNALLAVKNAQIGLSMIQSAHAHILDALNARLAGQATLYAQTLPGKIEVFKAKLDTVGRQIGQWLIPKLTDVATFAQNAFSTFAKNPALLGLGAAVIGAPIIAALGAFAYQHIITPIMNLGRVFTGEGSIGSRLQQLFGGKNAPIAANTDATQLNTDAITRLTEQLGLTNKELPAAGGEGAAAGAGAGAAAEERAGAAGAGLALGRAGIYGLALAIAGHFAGEKLGETSRSNVSPTGTYDTGIKGRFANALDPLSPEARYQQSFLIGSAKQLGVDVSHGIETGFAHLNSMQGPFGFHNREVQSYKNWKSTPLDQGAFTGLSSKTAALEKMFASGRAEPDHATKTLQEAQMKALGEIAKGLEGKDKSPQLVKLLNEDGLGKLIGTSSGMLIGRALTSALKSQQHDWNLPYVISQGFAKVDGTIGKSLDAHLSNSAAHQLGASKSTTVSGQVLQRAGTSLQQAAQQLGGPAGSLSTAASELQNAATDLANAAAKQSTKGGGKGGRRAKR